MVRILNLTPHAVTIVAADGTVARTIPSDGVARVMQTMRPAGLLDGIAIVDTVYGEPIDLPEKRANTFIIVSAVTAQAAKAVGRPTDDLLFPADFVRDDAGRIIGCRALARA